MTFLKPIAGRAVTVKLSAGPGPAGSRRHLYTAIFGGRPYRLELLPGEFVPSKRVAEVSGLMPRFQSSRSVRG
jgi:hypothetical protein